MALVTYSLATIVRLRGMVKHLEALETADCIPDVMVVYLAISILSIMLSRVLCIGIAGW